MRSAHAARRLVWAFHRYLGGGIAAIVLTPVARVVLLCHSYVPGWRVPTGGIRAGEGSETAAVCELREEIGPHAWSDTEVLGPSHDFALDPPNLVDVVVVRDALYSPR